MDFEKIIEQLRKRETAISQERNRLRDLIDELQALDDSCERAEEHLGCAIDALSELV